MNNYTLEELKDVLLDSESLTSSFLNNKLSLKSFIKKTNIDCLFKTRTTSLLLELYSEFHNITHELTIDKYSALLLYNNGISHNAYSHNYKKVNENVLEELKSLCKSKLSNGLNNLYDYELLLGLKQYNIILPKHVSDIEIIMGAQEEQSLVTVPLNNTSRPLFSDPSALKTLSYDIKGQRVILYSGDTEIKTEVQIKKGWVTNWKKQWLNVSPQQMKPYSEKY